MSEQEEQQCGQEAKTLGGRVWVCTRQPHPSHPDHHVYVRKDGEL